MLSWSDDRQYSAIEKPLTLPNGLQLTYGRINALAGDFYGTDNPISDGSNFGVQCTRFTAAFDTLGVEKQRAPGEARKIMRILDDEVKIIKTALDNGVDPSGAYNNLSDPNAALQLATVFRPGGFPSYLGLSLINWDHFGKDARTAYEAGHYTALAKAKEGNLQLAYCLNAFADHFLEDSFSAGHVRTPRRALHNSWIPAWDLLAKVNKLAPLCPLADYSALLNTTTSTDGSSSLQYMHDEENSIGVDVKNNRGDKWKMYGDKRLLDKANARNMEICKEAVQASANEVYDAWKNKTNLGVKQYAYLNLVPDLDAAQQGQQMAALFVGGTGGHDLKRRTNLNDRRSQNWTSNWLAVKSIVDIKLSGRWDYPITIDGPKQSQH